MQAATNLLIFPFSQKHTMQAENIHYADFIEIKPEVMLGKPVLKGTRITVEMILEELSGGLTMEDLLEAYPTITQEGILAAFGFAAAMLKGEKIYLTAV